MLLVDNVTLQERLHCPDCQGRLTVSSDDGLRCSVCERCLLVVNGIAHFAERSANADWCLGFGTHHGLLASDLTARIKIAAADRWPRAFGDTIEFACGVGAIAGAPGLMTNAILTNEVVRSLLVLGTDPEHLLACQARAAAVDLGGNRPASFALIAPSQNIIRDAVADTVVGGPVLAAISDVRAFLSMVYQVLKPGGRALFVVLNQRYRKALCLTLAEAFAQHFAQHGAWPEECAGVVTLLAAFRHDLVHRDNRGLFDSDFLEDLSGEAGFAVADMIPLDPDPAGADTLTRVCLDAGASDAFARDFGPRAATAGRPFMRLLSYRDSSDLSLLWLAKAAGPTVRVYSGRSTRPPIIYPDPAAALGGATPRWSVELLGRDTPDGIALKVSGWCLSNIDALHVRVVLDGNAQTTPVWRCRPDVHEVLNRGRIYHPLNALCSGVEDQLRFPGVHPTDGACPLRIEIVLDGDLVVIGPAPETLIMDETVVIAH